MARKTVRRLTPDYVDPNSDGYYHPDRWLDMIERDKKALKILDEIIDKIIVLDNEHRYSITILMLMLWFRMNARYPEIRSLR